MSKQTINIGASPNDGTGTPLRTSFDYTNQNFTELYNALGGGVGLPGATTQVIFNDGGTNLAGDAGLVYNKTTDTLTAGNATITGAATVGTTLGVTGNLTATSSGPHKFGTTNYSQFDQSSLQFVGSRAAPGALSIFSNANRLFFQGDTGGYFFQNGASSATLMTIADAGNVTVGVGNLVMGTSGKGIDFSAVTGGTGTATANVLNDYEEGTFTPTVEGNTAAGTLTAPVRYGYYTKVGSLVTVQVYLGWTNLVGATGYMILGGLPFAASSSTNILSAVSFAYVNYIALTAGNVLNGLINPGTSYVELGQYPTGGGANTTVPIDTAGSIIYTATYRV